MKNTIQTFLLFFLLIFSTSYAQIIIKKGIYTANFSNTYRVPKYVSYYLYKGGGDCDRTKFKFLNDELTLKTAEESDYVGTIYDRGHLANAEDFAFDCTNQELTFRYYNCLPQTANLNRGVWKTNETLVRKWSQTEKLYIICGGYFGNTKTGNITVPNNCWKVVQSVKTKKVLFCGWFSNSSNASMQEISIAELEKKLKSKIILLK